MKKFFLIVVTSITFAAYAATPWTQTDIAAIRKDHRDQINSIAKAVKDERAVPVRFSQFQRLALIQTGNQKIDDHLYALGTWLGNLSYQRDALTLINETGKKMQELLAPIRKAIETPETSAATRATLKNLYNTIVTLMTEYADRLKADGALEIQLAPIKISTLR